MKRNISIIIIAAFLLISPLHNLAQAPPHPNGGSAPGEGNVPVGGNAPISGGVVILLALGAAYGAYKLFRLQQESVNY